MNEGGDWAKLSKEDQHAWEVGALRVKRIVLERAMAKLLEVVSHGS